MLAQKLKSSCKLISVSFGFISSYLAYHYQRTVDEIKVNQNFDVLHSWVEWRSKMAYEKTESLLMKYCHWLSMSSLFHKMDFTSILIFLAENQKTSFMHDLCIKLLASIEFPQDVDMEYYLNKCDPTTLIGLARSRDVNLQWFSSQSATAGTLPQEIDDDVETLLRCQMEKVIEDIRRSLAIDENKQECSTWLFQKVVNDHIPDDPVPNIMVDLSTERDSISLSAARSKVPLSKHLNNYLKILRQYSANEFVNSNEELSNKIIKVVHNIVSVFANDEDEEKRVDVFQKCGNIIANIACNDENRRCVVHHNFLPLLMQWKSSKETTLQIVADRALVNLDSLDLSANMKKLSDGIYVLYPNCRSREDTDVDVVFIHGIQGSPFYTWRQGDGPDKTMFTKCWPKDWLPADYPNIRVICVQYESVFSDWFLSCPMEDNKRSLDVQAKVIKQKLEDCGVGERPIVWVSHSMGGLITKKMLSLSADKLDQSNILSSTKGLVFYSVPHLGSPFATKTGRARFVLFPSKEVTEVEQNAENLRKLHEEFSELRKRYKIDCLDFGESKPLKLPYVKYGQMIVPPTSSNVGYGRFVLLDTNHQEVCKPISKVDPRYWEVSSMVRKVLQENTKRKKIFMEMCSKD